jgi:Cu2+-exporting ATPase
VSGTGSNIVACPGCLAVPDRAVAPPPPAQARLVLSLPGIHCQNCIAAVEDILGRRDGVREARVNLTLKRAMIDADPEVSAAELASHLTAEGFEAHELDPAALGETASATDERNLLMRVAVAGFAAMNVMLLSVAVWSGATDATRDLFHWVSAAIALPAIGYAAQPFFRQAWSALRVGRLNMDVPISLAILLALATSLWETALSGAHAYFDAAIMLTFFLLAGRWLEARTRRAARSAAEELTALEVPRAVKLTLDGPVDVPIAEVRIGDRILVKPGARVPVDGTVMQGASEVDRSMLTGEPVPEVRKEGDSLLAGEINLTGPLQLRADAVGQETSLQRMAALVAVAESGRARYQPLADAAAKLYAPGVHILAFLAFVGWLVWAGDFRVALNIAAAVLIITCPCALGLAVPAVTTAASGRLFANGLLIKDPTALERLAEADHVIFDKTGTLTEGRPTLVDWSDLTDEDKTRALALAQASDHPLSRALVARAREEGLFPATVSRIEECPGYGTRGFQEGQEIRLGRPAWVGLDTDDAGLCAAFVCGSGRAKLMRFEDALRGGAETLVGALKAQGMGVSLLTGDRPAAAKSVGAALGIEAAFGNMLPADKAAYICKLRDQGLHVLMIGDGINDTAALSAAHVSISPAEAMDAARAASDIVLLGKSLHPIADAIETARVARRRISQNFRIATVYNVCAVPLAVAGLATPLIAALAMSLSSLTVSINALRLGEHR